MLWERSNVIGLARATCTSCHGYGMRHVHAGTEAPCNCVFRAIFRACYRRFRECAALGPRTGSVSLEFCGGPEGYRTYSRKREEYMADFCLVSRRVLDDLEYQIFRYHYLLGADGNLCSRRLNMDRGDFYHAVYRIESRLGRTFAELQPYPLYPLSDYFGGTVRAVERRTPVMETDYRRTRAKSFPLPLSA